MGGVTVSQEGEKRLASVWRLGKDWTAPGVSSIWWCSADVRCLLPAAPFYDGERLRVQVIDGGMGCPRRNGHREVLRREGEQNT